MKTKPTVLALGLSATLLQAEDADLAKKLANPIADLISVPIQSNYDFVGARYYAEKPDNGPEWGLRFGLTFLFPK